MPEPQMPCVCVSLLIEDSASLGVEQDRSPRPPRLCLRLGNGFEQPLLRMFGEIPCEAFHQVANHWVCLNYIGRAFGGLGVNHANPSCKWATSALRIRADHRFPQHRGPS